MTLYNVDIFDRQLEFVYNATASVTDIDDDYLSPNVNSIAVPSTSLIESGQFIRLESKSFTFFGLIVDASPGETDTIVRFKSFISIFDEPFLFDSMLQRSTSLEETMARYISDLYILNEDIEQNLPITITVDPNIDLTNSWALGLVPERDDTYFCIGNLYKDLIITALKKYGVVIDVVPNLSNRVVNLRITKKYDVFKIDADLENVYVKTLKYNNSSSGPNKLTVYNAEDFGQSVTFYVHTDDSWDTEDRDRVLPVVQEVKSVTPAYDVEDHDEAFYEAAVDAAYSTISGSAYDNLIELETQIGDTIVKPEQLLIGQVVSIWYWGDMYSSILTGRIIKNNKITLLFGSERIEYSKRAAF